MRVWLPVILILILLIVYLNRSYAAIYDFISSQNLKSSDNQTTYYFTGTQNNGNVRLVAIGDSLSAGVGTNYYQQSLPYQIAQELSKKHNLVTLTNLSLPGARSLDVLKKQVPATISLNPDYISLLIGINDIHGLVPITIFTDNFRTILEQLSTKTSAQIILFNIPYLGSDKLIHFPYNYLLDLQTKQYNSTITSFCQFPRIHCVDLYSNTRIIFSKNSDFYAPDQFHPSGPGYLMWSKLINDKILGD